MLLRGWLLTLAGKAVGRHPRHQDGDHEVMRSTGATAYAPWYWSCLAKTYADLGQAGDARRCIEDALAVMEATKEKWCEPEIRRIASEIAPHQP